MALTTMLGVGTLAAFGAGALSTAPSAGAASTTSTLYVGSGGNSTITSFSLPAKGNVAPTATVEATPTIYPYAMAFDVDGDLWTANTNSTIEEFTPAQLAAGGSQAPALTVTVTGAGFDGLAFNGAGDLWAADIERNKLVELTPAQLAAGGVQAPAVVITSDATSLAAPEDLAFDASGDLWASNSTNDTVVEFTPAQLASSGSPSPEVTISSHTTSLTYPTGVAFATSGDLWVANDTNTTLVAYTPSQLASGGSLVPATTISGLDGPWQVAFDNQGNLWVGNNENSTVAGYSPSQLSTGGATLVPANLIAGTTTTLNGPLGVAVKAPPTVSSLSPTTGPATGGTTVTITGTGFTSGSTVNFGSSAATSVTDISPFELTAVAPAGSGIVTVTVSTFAGTSATSSADQYTYVSTGYDLVGSDGGVFVFPTGQPYGFYGSLPGLHVVPNKPIVGMVPTITGKGYFLVAADGGVFAFGTAPFLGSLPGIKVTPSAPIAGIVAAATDKGYFLVGKDGGVFAFGTVPFLGSLPGKGISVNNIIGITSTPSGNGYWLVSATGTVYAFGAAKSLGTAKGTSSPVSAIAGTPTGAGYWITTQNGTVYPFGTAKKFGTLPALGVTPGPAGDRHRPHLGHNRVLAARSRRRHLRLRPGPVRRLTAGTGCPRQQHRGGGAQLRIPPIGEN